MGWLTSIEQSPSVFAASNADGWGDHWWTPHAPFSSASGVNVSAEAALTLSALWAAVKIISEDLASLPLILYRRQPDGGRSRATQHQLYSVLRHQPNAWQTAYEYWEMQVGHLLLRGNAYSVIVPGRRGFADQLIPKHPDRMTPERLPSGRVRYRYRAPDGAEEVFSADQIQHLRGFSSDGLSGLSLVQYAAQSLGGAIAADSYAHRFFGQGLAPAAVVSHPGTLEGEGQANLRQSIRDYTAGLKNAHGLLILEEGMSWQQVGISPEDAQLVAVREYGVEEVARWTNMPLHKLRSNKQAQTYASVEQFNLDYVVSTLRPMAVRIEQAIRRDLILQEDTFFAEFLLDALLRANTRERAAFYHIGIQDGWLNRNEVRRKENLNPGPHELDAFLEPLNMAPAGTRGAASAAVAKAQPAVVEPALGTPSRAEAIAQAAAERLVRKEVVSVTRAAKKHAKDTEAFTAWVRTFYDGHAAVVADTLMVTSEEARAYCARQSARVEAHGVAAMLDWETQVPPQLAATALTEATHELSACE